MKDLIFLVKEQERAKKIFQTVLLFLGGFHDLRGHPHKDFL